VLPPKPNVPTSPPTRIFPDGGDGGDSASGMLRRPNSSELLSHVAASEDNVYRSIAMKK